MIGGFNYNGEGATSSGLSSPSASDVANQFNSFGGTQIRASDVSNIRSDGNGGYMADIWGQIHTVSSEEGSTTVSGFDGVRSSSTGNGGSQGGQGPQGQSLVMHNGQMGYWEISCSLIGIPFRLKESIALSIYTVFHSEIAAVSNVRPLAR